jgi:hypothetical protein
MTMHGKEIKGSLGGDNELGTERHHLGGYGGETVGLSFGNIVKTIKTDELRALKGIKGTRGGQRAKRSV